MYLGRLCGVALLIMVDSASAQEPWTPGGCAGLDADSVESAIRGCQGEFVDPAEAALIGEGPATGPPFLSDQPFDSMSGKAWAPSGLSRAPAPSDQVGAAPPPVPPAPPARLLVQIDAETWASDQRRDRAAVHDATGPSARGEFWRPPSRLAPLTPVAEPHIEVDGQVVPMDDWQNGRVPDSSADPVVEDDPVQDPGSAAPLQAEVMHSAVIDGVTVEMDAVSVRLLELILRSAATTDAELSPAVRAEVLAEPFE